MPRKGGSSIGVLIAGALAGVVGALLFAPKAGKDTRDLVSRKSKEYITAVREKLQRRKSDGDHHTTLGGNSAILPATTMRRR